MNIKVEVRISRGSDDLFRIDLLDEASGINFVHIKMTPDIFAKCITNRVINDHPCEVRDLANVGKQKITERRTTRVPKILVNGGDRRACEQWLENNRREDGWIIESYLGSQGSIPWDEDDAILNYKVHKYVDAAEWEKT